MASTALQWACWHMTDRDVHSALVRWLAAITGLGVIKDHQGEDRPAQPYIMVNMLGSAPLRDRPAMTEYQHGDTGDMGTADVYPPVTATPVIEVEWRFSVHAYGEHPTDILRPIRSAMHLAQKQEPLLPSLVIHDISQIRNVPDWINEKWEPRGQMDLFLRGFTRDGFEIDVIEEAPFDIARR